MPFHTAWRPVWGAACSGAAALSREIACEWRILGALAMREMTTRFGRRNIGFFWLIAEPLLFTGGVLAVWLLIRPAYEHGVRLAPFVMTGYLPLLLIRHAMARAALCIQSNTGLLYHRQISVVHLVVARLGLEIAGVTLAFVVCFAILGLLGQVEPPQAVHLTYLGWFLLGWFVTGLGLVIAALSEMSDVVERLVGVLSYIIIPISGAFFMVGWLPDQAREIVLLSPIVHCFEMIRAGFLGEFVRTYYDPAYVAAWSLGLTFVGLLLLAHVQRRLEVE